MSEYSNEINNSINGVIHAEFQKAVDHWGTCPVNVGNQVFDSPDWKNALRLGLKWKGACGKLNYFNSPICKCGAHYDDHHSFASGELHIIPPSCPICEEIDEMQAALRRAIQMGGL